MHDRLAAAGTVALLCGSLGIAHADDDLSLDVGGGSNPKTGDVARKLELRHVTKGTFVQGSPPTEPQREADETVRNVTLTHSFWLGKTPVTRAQFARFVSETRHVTDAEKGQTGGTGLDAKTGTLVPKKEFSWRNPGFVQKDEDPVVLVTFGDANAFTAWASRKTGRRVRLPTEAEWEYAARAGTTTPWYSATKEEDALALGWFRLNASGMTHPVGSKKANPWGFFDMGGNVAQWCRDVYAPYPPGDATDPENATNAGADPERRVLRGSSWIRDPKRARSAARSKSAPGSRSAEHGFRVAVDDEVSVAPGLLPPPNTDFAPASPVGSAATPLFDADASAAAVLALTPPRPASEGISWMMFAAPILSAGAAIAWVLARRRSKPTTERARPAIPEPIAAWPAMPPRPSTTDDPPPSIDSRGSVMTRMGPPTPPRLPSPPASFGAIPLSLPKPLPPAESPEPTSVTGPVQPRHAFVDKRESHSPFRAPLITPEAILVPTAPAPASSAPVPRRSEPPRPRKSEPAPPLPPAPSTSVPSAPLARKSEPARPPPPLPPKAPSPSMPPPLPASSTSVSPSPDATLETKPPELRAFDAWMNAAKLEAAKASERRLAAAKAMQEKDSDSKLADLASPEPDVEGPPAPPGSNPKTS